MKKIIQVVGARPNFIKIAPLHQAFKAINFIEAKIVHTGQHYDERMSGIFFKQLDLPQPDYFLGINSSTHTQITANIMLEFEKVVIAEKPDLVVVVGDVNSTIACALVAAQAGIPLAHIEAGLRSGNKNMPEEINRILTDHISDYLFVTEQSGMLNLAQEGIPDEKVFFVGNIMIDALKFYKNKKVNIDLQEDFDVKTKEYILVTMHRPSNVDKPERLLNVIKIVEACAKHKKVLFPIHPRTLNNLKKFELLERLTKTKSIKLLEPQGYLEFLKLMEGAALVLTDSGGIQEETTFLQIPCLTFRSSTERPITLNLGSNQLIKKLDPQITSQKVLEILSGNLKKGSTPPLWDGRTANRIAKILSEKIYSKKVKVT